MGCYLRTRKYSFTLLQPLKYTKMNSSSFTIKKSVLLNTLKELTKVLNKVSKYKFTVLEMTVTDEN